MAMNASNREAGPYRRIKQVPYHSSNRQEFGQRFHSKQKESAKFSRGDLSWKISGKQRRRKKWDKDQILLENAEGSGGRVMAFCA